MSYNDLPQFVIQPDFKRGNLKNTDFGLNLKTKNLKGDVFFEK